MGSNIVLRYFDCRGRAQALRDALTDARLDFSDERFTVGPAWVAAKDAAGGGPFGNLPVLEWDGDIVGQTLPIAGYLARRLGHYDGLDAMGIARLEMVTSAAYLDMIFEVASMIWMLPPDTDARDTPVFTRQEPRIIDKIARFERALGTGSAPYFGGDRPAVADYFVAEATGIAEAAFPTRVARALAAAPRIAELVSSVSARPGVARILAEGRRPERLTAAPHEPLVLERARRWDATPAPAA
jgi:glutathione S-transferase